jgi:hypothetical protein
MCVCVRVYACVPASVGTAMCSASQGENKNEAQQTRTPHYSTSSTVQTAVVSLLPHTPHTTHSRDIYTFTTPTQTGAELPHTDLPSHTLSHIYMAP